MGIDKYVYFGYTVHTEYIQYLIRRYDFGSDNQ